MKEEMPISDARVYQPPAKLRKRKETSENVSFEEKVIQPNE